MTTKHGPWTLTASDPKVVWRCDSCGQELEFAPEGSDESPTSSTKAPPANIDVYCGGTCDDHKDRLRAEGKEPPVTPKETAVLIDENARMRRAIEAIKRDPMFDVLDLPTAAAIRDADVEVKK